MAAARAAFSERGHDGTTLADIAARLGVSPAALLRHAPTKSALFAAAMSERPAAEHKLPMAFLAEADPAQPRAVLRQLALTAIPFIQATLSESIARWMFDKAASALPLRLPFDPRSANSPPKIVFAMLEAYIRRAVRAGAMRVRDPQAAAMAFMGALNAYVFFHLVLKVVDPPLPLERYVDTVLDVWTDGAIVEKPRARRRKEAR
jgi:AcrR family transcriptional regulator